MIRHWLLTDKLENFGLARAICKHEPNLLQSGCNKLTSSVYRWNIIVVVGGATDADTLPLMVVKCTSKKLLQTS
jgi:hypothetical protein